MNYRLAFSVRRAGRLRLFVSRVYVSLYAHRRASHYTAGGCRRYQDGNLDMQMTEAEYRAARTWANRRGGFAPLQSSIRFSFSFFFIFFFYGASLLLLFILFHVEYSIAHSLPRSPTSNTVRPSVSPKFKRAPSPSPLTLDQTKSHPFLSTSPCTSFRMPNIRRVLDFAERSTSPVLRAS